MTIADRIKEIRIKHSPKLSQTDFGALLGVSKDVIANLEYGRVQLSDSMAKLICMTFKVNPIWLETGEGDPYDTRKPDLGQEIRDIMRGEDPFAAAVMTSLAQMTPEWWGAFREKLYEEVDKQKKNGRG